MEIKKLANNSLNFIIRRFIELTGIFVSIASLLLLIALVSYSPNDPNFIFPENKDIENILGFKGSFVSDLFLQSFGIMSYLISLTLIVTGINIFRLMDK